MEGDEGNSQRMESFEDCLTKEVFRNPVVWDSLGGYLSTGDLKDCRLVCKAFDSRVVDCRKWKEGVCWQLHLKEDNWSDPRISSLKVRLSSVKVTISGTGPEETEALEKLPNIFKDMKSLSVEFEEKQEPKWDEEPQDLIEWKMSELKELGTIVNVSLAVMLAQSSSQLTTLILPKEMLSFLSCIDNAAVFNNPKALERIQGLKTLKSHEIFNNPGSIVTLMTRDSKDLCFLKMMENQNSKVPSNLNSVEELRLAIHKYGDYPSFPHKDLQALLERREKDLKTLELGVIDIFKTFSHLHFPNLTHLSLRISGWMLSDFCDFLSKLSKPLDSLTLKVHGTLSRALQKVIEEKSGNLSSLELKFWQLEEGVDWEWLRSCDKLHSFSLTTPSFDGRGRRNGASLKIEDVLLFLPENGMRKISLRSGWNRTLTTRYELEKIFMDPKFSQLEELRIFLLPWAVRDPVLEVLGSRERFPKLRKLHLSHTHHYSGELKGDKAFWQGLDDVCLRKMSGDLREEPLVEKLGKSKNLRRLTIRNKWNETTFPLIDLKRIVESSQALDTLTVPCKYFKPYPAEAEIVSHKPHRLKNIKNLCSAYSTESYDSDSDVEFKYEHKHSFLFSEVVSGPQERGD